MSEPFQGVPACIEHAMYGFMLSQVLFVGDETGMFDLFTNGNAYSANDVANALHANDDAVDRMLVAAVAAGILEKSNNLYEMSIELRSYFLRENTAFGENRFSHFRDITTKTFQYLKEAMYDGKTKINKVLAMSQGADVFKNIYADSTTAKNFLESMWMLGYTPACELVEKYSFSCFKKLVDVGGATGSFSIAALNANKKLKAVVYDLKEVKPYLEEKRNKFSMKNRLTFKAGNFIKDMRFPEGDIYVLGYILSDWSTEQGSILLKKIYDHLPVGGIVVVLEKLFVEDKSGPLSTAIMNLAMMLETGGRHRTKAEYFCWLEKVGFRNFKCIYSSGEKHMMVAEK